ncbi:hypothetical protein ACFQS3_02520 [Glycomyces mayteni]|uniref:Uncharacterized protein n=1 Tax=Glycomyces mayteni TaxID=543887 RepID=A0ABW2D196_9ACTN
MRYLVSDNNKECTSKICYCWMCKDRDTCEYGGCKAPRATEENQKKYGKYLPLCVRCAGFEFRRNLKWSN